MIVGTKETNLNGVTALDIPALTIYRYLIVWLDRKYNETVHGILL